MKQLPVPYHSQEKHHTCGPASLRMVLAYFDEYHLEQKISRKTKTNSWRGTTRKNLVRAAVKAGYYVYEDTEASLAQIKWFVNHELPIIVNFIEPSENEGHYGVVTGYDPKRLLLNDPWNGRNFHLARKTFEKRWFGARDRKQRWLMVVGRSDFRPQPYDDGEDLLTGTFHLPRP